MKRFDKFLTALCALVFAFVLFVLGTRDACASESLDIRLTAGGYSTHLLSKDVTNESHDHFAVQVGRVEVGRFNNSYGRESYYAAYEARWENVLGPHVDAFLKSGVVYGYVDCLDRGSGIPKKRTPSEVADAQQQGWDDWLNEEEAEPEKRDVDTSGAWCPMVAPGLRYTKWEIEPELTLVGDAVNIGASYEFDLMRL